MWSTTPSSGWIGPSHHRRTSSLTTSPWARSSDTGDDTHAHTHTHAYRVFPKESHPDSQNLTDWYLDIYSDTHTHSWCLTLSEYQQKDMFVWRWMQLFPFGLRGWITGSASRCRRPENHNFIIYGVHVHLSNKLFLHWWCSLHFGEFNIIFELLFSKKWNPLYKHLTTLCQLSFPWLALSLVYAMSVSGELSVWGLVMHYWAAVMKPSHLRSDVWLDAASVCFCTLDIDCHSSMMHLLNWEHVL